ncbi:hypothetical protein VH570_17830 [Sphingobium sp. HT1-2]|jgi:hypothetical protein|uniref:hypothetical protein n=1 Tax=Sphingobium sp. HT1-2 TaxID=3111640 RepID=UPI003C079EFB
MSERLLKVQSVEVLSAEVNSRTINSSNGRSFEKHEQVAKIHVVDQQGDVSSLKMKIGVDARNPYAPGFYVFSQGQTFLGKNGNFDQLKTSMFVKLLSFDEAVSEIEAIRRRFQNFRDIMVSEAAREKLKAA